MNSLVNLLPKGESVNESDIAADKIEKCTMTNPDTEENGDEEHHNNIHPEEGEEEGGGVACHTQ